jgi:hypothetical protein
VLDTPGQPLLNRNFPRASVFRAADIVRARGCAEAFA